MSGTTVTVSSAAQLLAAAKAAKTGGMILLAPCNYGAVSRSNLAPARTITVRSDDPDNDAVFRTLNMMRAHNIVIEDIDLHRPLAPGASQKT